MSDKYVRICGGDYSSVPIKQHPLLDRKFGAIKGVGGSTVREAIGFLLDHIPFLLLPDLAIKELYTGTFFGEKQMISLNFRGEIKQDHVAFDFRLSGSNHYDTHACVFFDTKNDQHILVYSLLDNRGFTLEFKFQNTNFCVCIAVNKSQGRGYIIESSSGFISNDNDDWDRLRKDGKCHRHHLHELVRVLRDRQDDLLWHDMEENPVSELMKKRSARKFVSSQIWDYLQNYQ
jgi:hypothetical protein